MRRNNFRLLAGGALVLMGLLVLLQEMGIIPSVNWFWAAVFIFGGIAFLIVFARDRSRWWALIPGMTLAGVGVTMLLPAPLSYLGGAITLGAVGLSFWLIYFSAHENWWAIIPGGALLTLAAISVATSSLPDMALGALLFFGLSLTFFFVAVLPNPHGRMTWAFIPAGILLLFALVAFSARFQEYAVYVWPVALIGAGIYLLFLYFRRSNVG
jgi:hypothetical protein